jgi:hypothetical protein
MPRINPFNAAAFTFGIELETVIPDTSTIHVGPYHGGCPVTAAPTFRGMFWKAERDGSIQAPRGFRAAEFVSPVLQGEEGIEAVLAFVAWLKEQGARVNASCGCHIHIGLDSVIGNASTTARNAYMRKLAAVVNINAGAIYAQTGTRRDLNRYCRPLDENVRETLDRAVRDGCPVAYRTDRYRILNLTNVESRGTVEFRAFAGTLNRSKILHHIWTCLFLAGFAGELKRVPWNGQGWASMDGGEGEKALRGLWKKAGNHALVGAIGERKRDMRRVALAMARKFDARATA